MSAAVARAVGFEHAGNLNATWNCFKKFTVISWITFLIQSASDSQIQGFSYETLLDVLELLHSELSSSNLRREKHVTEFLDWSRSFIHRVLELRIRRSDFELIRVIGRGAFGEVSVVQMRGTHNIYAMKTLSKSGFEILNLNW